MRERTFTVGEANELLPRLRGVLGELARSRGELDHRMDRIKILDALWGARVREPRNPDREEFLAERAGVRRSIREIERLVEEELLALGVRFPSGGLEHGLVDFPTTLDGRIVYLCWRVDEPELEWWHEVQGGFAGRRPITPQLRERMGKGPEAPPAPGAGPTSAPD